MNGQLALPGRSRIAWVLNLPSKPMRHPLNELRRGYRVDHLTYVLSRIDTVLPLEMNQVSENLTMTLGRVTALFALGAIALADAALDTPESGLRQVRFRYCLPGH